MLSFLRSRIAYAAPRRYVADRIVKRWRLIAFHMKLSIASNRQPTFVHRL
jgi:hypothetical protein